MQNELPNKEIVNFLTKTEFSGSLFDTLKIKYRTYICPFADLISKVKPGDQVGDIGCGSGQFLLLVSQFADKPQSVYGIEIKQRLIENAKTLFQKHSVIESRFETFDGSHFPAQLKNMDIIFLIDVLHHVPKKHQETFMNDLVSLMKPGARLVLKDINAASPLVVANKLHDMIFAGEVGNEWKMNDARKLLEDNGMEIIEQVKRRMYVYPHYTLVATKK